jgi:hypothetical protein
MEYVLRGLDFCFAYLDDILIYSLSLKEHEQHLWALFDLLQKYGNLINTGKCVFRTRGITFLGYKVSAEDSQPLEELVTHFKEYQTPKPVSQFRRFLFMLKYYRLFLPHAASDQAPLHDALSGPKVNDFHPIRCTPTPHEAFEKCKANLSRAILVEHPDLSAPLTLVTDGYTS